MSLATADVRTSPGHCAERSALKRSAPKRSTGDRDWARTLAAGLAFGLPLRAVLRDDHDGEDTIYILSQLLGLTESAIDGLAARGVVDLPE
jgi:hypothetical protein